jgi:hypothetical protein
MNTKTLMYGLIFVLALGMAANQAAAQPADAGQPDMAAMMKMWEDMAAPAKQHQQLAEMVGTWDAEVSMWMEPSAPPMTSTGVGTFSLMLGGRYLRHDFEGNMMGRTFKGLGITGYDKFRQEYFDLWFDDMSTGMLLMRGVADSAGTVVHYTGKMDDPMAGRKDIPSRTVMTKIGGDNCKMEMYVTDESGNEMKTMEIVYTRRK